jgi:DNA-binding transcriptional MerR regulator
MTLTVSKLAARVGLSADTIRYYERAGLLPRPIAPHPATAPRGKL